MSMGGSRDIRLIVNGAVYVVAASPAASLLQVLHNDLGLNGPKYGCGLGECGACMVLLDGVPTRACVIPASGAAGRRVTTLEGLGTRESPHPVQRAFIEAQAAQCGYCINGMIMESAAFLAKTKAPTEAAIKEALANNLCRCGTHLRIVKAVKR